MFQLNLNELYHHPCEYDVPVMSSRVVEVHKGIKNEQQAKLTNLEKSMESGGEWRVR